MNATPSQQNKIQIIPLQAKPITIITELPWINDILAQYRKPIE